MRTAEFASLAHEIRTLTAISTKLILHNLEEEIARQCPGINVPHYGVLRILECHPSTIKELSDQMLLAPSTLVPIVDRLENEGLVVRGRDPDDRRRTPLMLTDHARQMMAKMPSIEQHNPLGQALQALGPRKSHELSHLLQELVTELAHDEGIVQHILTMSARITDLGSGCARGKAAEHIKTSTD